MSYNLTFYNTISDSNALNKKIYKIINYSINFKEKDNNLQELDLKLRIQLTNKYNINYARIVYVSKTLYYFVKILPDSNAVDLFTVHLTLDPLMSYRNEILGLSVITERNTNNYNVYLPDSEQKITSQYKQFYHTFKGGDIPYFTPHKSTLLTLVGSE